MENIEEELIHCLRHIAYDIHQIANNTKQEEVHDLIRCRDCEFWEKSEDSLQGRCEIRGEYPTGAYFCGTAKRK